MEDSVTRSLQGTRHCLIQRVASTAFLDVNVLLSDNKERVRSIMAGFCRPSLEVVHIISSHILMARS